MCQKLIIEAEWDHSLEIKNLAQRIFFDLKKRRKNNKQGGWGFDKFGKKTF